MENFNDTGVLNMDTKKLFSKVKTMADGVISLHSIENKDVEQLFKLYNNKEIFKQCGVTSYMSNIDEAYEVIPLIKKDFIEQKEIQWGMFIEENDLLIGIIVVCNIDIKINKLEIGFFIHPDYWNKGYAKRSVKLLLSYLFNEIDVNRIEAEVLPVNKYSKKVLVSNGFIKEGTIRQGTYWEKFGVVDLEIYSILKEEYKEQKPAHNKR